MARRKKLGGQMEGGEASTERSSFAGQSRPNELRMDALSAATSDLSKPEFTRAQAMWGLAEILLSIFLELPAEERAKYDVPSPRVVGRVV